MLFGIFWWRVLDLVLGMLENDLHTLLLSKNVAWANIFDIMISSFYDFPKKLPFFLLQVPPRGIYHKKKSELQNFRYKWLFFHLIKLIFYKFQTSAWRDWKTSRNNLLWSQMLKLSQTSMPFANILQTLLRQRSLNVD